MTLSFYECLPQFFCSNSVFWIWFLLFPGKGHFLYTNIFLIDFWIHSLTPVLIDISIWFFPTTFMLRVSFSPAPECVEADCWNRGFPPPPCHRGLLLLCYTRLHERLRRERVFCKAIYTTLKYLDWTWTDGTDGTDVDLSLIHISEPTRPY